VDVRIVTTWMYLYHNGFHQRTRKLFIVSVHRIVTRVPANDPTRGTSLSLGATKFSNVTTQISLRLYVLRPWRLRQSAVKINVLERFGSGAQKRNQNFVAHLISHGATFCQALHCVYVAYFCLSLAALFALSFLACTLVPHHIPGPLYIIFPFISVLSLPPASRCIP